MKTNTAAGLLLLLLVELLASQLGTAQLTGSDLVNSAMGRSRKDVEDQELKKLREIFLGQEAEKAAMQKKALLSQFAMTMTPAQPQATKCAACSAKHDEREYHVMDGQKGGGTCPCLKHVRGLMERQRRKKFICRLLKQSLKPKYVVFNQYPSPCHKNRHRPSCHHHSHSMQAFSPILPPIMPSIIQPAYPQAAAPNQPCVADKARNMVNRVKEKLMFLKIKYPQLFNEQPSIPVAGVFPPSIPAAGVFPPSIPAAGMFPSSKPYHHHRHRHHRYRPRLRRWWKRLRKLNPFSRH